MFKRTSRAAEKWFALEGLLLRSLHSCGVVAVSISVFRAVVSWLHVTNRRSGERYRKIKLFIPPPLHGAISDTTAALHGQFLGLLWFFFHRKEKNCASAADSLAGACLVYPERLELISDHHANPSASAARGLSGPKCRECLKIGSA
jgi:hypothetical protein